ncbi:MAG: hypothetical protein IH628_14380 [Proteobacteria bacterium]|nr:hypothetical protein [Pseudomonadota bacterium]
MKMRTLKRIALPLTVIGLWLILLAARPLTAAGPDAVIVLTTGEPEKIVASLPLEAGAPFHLDYINSIYLQPVRETFVYEPKEGLFVIAVETPSAGVFVYLDLVPQEPGKARLRRKLEEIRLLSTDYRNHRLTVGATVLPLKGLAPDGLTLILRVLPGRQCAP